jgi:hypothetical protein
LAIAQANANDYQRRENQRLMEENERLKDRVSNLFALREDDPPPAALPPPEPLAAAQKYGSGYQMTVTEGPTGGIAERNHQKGWGKRR